AASRLLYLLPLIAAFWLYRPLYPEGHAARQQGFAGAYTHSRVICFTDYNPEVYKPVRRLVAQIPLGPNTLLLNQLHRPELLHPARAFATEVDLLLKMRARQESPDWHVWRSDSIAAEDVRKVAELVWIEAQCSGPNLVEQTLVADWTGRIGRAVTSRSVYGGREGMPCATVYGLH
ncbi:MAG: hypothetical protein KDK39_15340, partial [Leptospiraceae bacterium]|nr:hypothetical protein [Leptospiraceae bacterium]